MIEDHIDNETHQSFKFVTAQGSVSSYRKSNNAPVENRIIYLSPLPKSDIEAGQVDEKTIEEWMDKNFEQLQKIVGASDEYAEIDLITELYVYVKYVPTLRKGFR